MLQNYYLPCLNGWRAISIILVMLFHGTWFYLSPEGVIPSPRLWEILQKGSYGVSIFFSISGFLITSRVLKEIETHGNFNAKEFYIKRFFRIIPPYFFYILVISTLSLFGTATITVDEILSSLSFLRIYLVENEGWYTGHFWSLCVEEHFYIILGFVFMLIRLKRIPLLLFASLVAILVWRSLSYRYKDQIDLDQVIRFTRALSQMDYMIWGCLYALLNSKLQNFYKKASGLQWPIIIITSIMILFEFRGKSSILPFMVATSIYFTVICPQSFTLKLLENKLVYFIGKISYSLYLWQQLFFTKPGAEFSQNFGLQNSWFSIVPIFSLAYFSYQYIEEPTIRVGRKWIKEKV